jgi:1-acyl-sn-glycerol-3-phosphate acyltransferase
LILGANEAVSRSESIPTDPMRTRMAARHRIQRAVGRLLAPFWFPLVSLFLRFRFGCRIEDIAESRRFYRKVRSESGAPLLICANHLTLVDSFFIAQALSSNWRFALDFDSVPWNTPEEINFAATAWNRVLVYVAKCIPIRRGGQREDIKQVLERIVHLLSRGEVAVLFPEGGRSRSGRVETDTAGWGVGRVLAGLEGCRVLCIYMRGAAQATWSAYPARGDRLRVSLALIEPKSDARGVRRTQDLSMQVMGQLAQMEAQYFAQIAGQSPTELGDQA